VDLGVPAGTPRTTVAVRDRTAGKGRDPPPRLGHRNDFPSPCTPIAPGTDYRECVPTPDVPARLRRAVLAACVLDDVDLEQAPRGVTLAGTGGSAVDLEWSAVADALAGHDPLSPVGRARVACLLGPARLAADHGRGAPQALREVSRLLALPPDHALHPGPGWVRGRVLGGALEVGIGFRGRTGPDRVLPVAPAALTAAGADPWPWWEELALHAERMGELVAQRLGVLARRRSALRPAGGCDVLTLLASRTLRKALAGLDGTGMRAVAVPERDRGWFDLSRVDPAFVTAAWAATDGPARGLARPLLVTGDEVVLARRGGRPERHAL